MLACEDVGVVLVVLRKSKGRNKRRLNANLVSCEEKPGALGGECVEGDGGLLAHVQLEVLQSSGEQDYVALLQSGGEQDAVVADEARVDGALENEERLGRPGVRVEGEHPTDCKVQPGVGDALRVDGGPRLRSHHDRSRPWMSVRNFGI